MPLLEKPLWEIEGEGSSKNMGLPIQDALQ